MIAALKRVADGVLGRSHAAITVPPFDGALKPNQLLELAETVAEFEHAEDIASDGARLLVADGERILTLEDGGVNEVTRFERPVTALACLADGGLAVALDGCEVQIAGGDGDGKRWTAANGQDFHAANAIAVAGDGRLLVTDGSAREKYSDWTRDLLEGGQSGRVVELEPGTGGARVLADGLAYAFGVCAAGEDIWTSESWQHRVVALGPSHRRPVPVLDRLPVYPSRISPASDGGFWLTAFAARTQLVEFVLREPAFRKRMMNEIEPRYWIAPALTSGNTFLEPLQGAHIKTMGILKPWAPPRSYGLVIRISAEGLPLFSLHSRVDGRNHGVVSAVEHAGSLYALAKGPQRLLRLSLEDVERSLQQ
jgi:sugar lactone lactonase YvrE